MKPDKIAEKFANGNGLKPVEPDDVVLERVRAVISLRLPRLFEQLLVHYRWEEDLDVAAATLFPNQDGTAPSSFLRAVTCDPHLWPVLGKAGFVPFARPDTGSYDPVCFDTNRRRGNDCPVVLLDHEAALTNGKTKIVRELYGAFAELLKTGSEFYSSDIPASAIEREKVAYRREGNVEWPEERGYHIADEEVGVRYFDSDGNLVQETPKKSGVAHGTRYFWDSGVLTNAEPYFEGKMHGTCRQWDVEGTLLGTYELCHGTGVDVWRDRDDRGRVTIVETHPLKDGKLHGFDRWWARENEVFEECHFVGGKRHGIERHWTEGQLDDGFPRFWVEDRKVGQEEYMRAVAADPTLPEYRAEDDQPGREQLSGGR